MLVRRLIQAQFLGALARKFSAWESSGGCANFTFMHNAKAYPVLTQTSPLAPFAIQRRDSGARDVQIQIFYCGVCHTGVKYRFVIDMAPLK